MMQVAIPLWASSITCARLKHARIDECCNATLHPYAPSLLIMNTQRLLGARPVTLARRCYLSMSLIEPITLITYRSCSRVVIVGAHCRLVITMSSGWVESNHLMQTICIPRQTHPHK